MSILVPVGMPGGINSGFPEIPNGWGTIRFGDHLEHLDRVSYRLWRRATSAISRDELVAWGTTNGMDYAKLLVDELLEPGLLIDLDSTDDAHLKSLMPVTVGECGGNGEQISATFSVAGRRGANVSTDVFGYQFLLRADGRHSISEICDAIDEARPAELELEVALFDRFVDDIAAWVRDEVLMLDTP